MEKNILKYEKPFKLDKKLIKRSVNWEQDEKDLLNRLVMEKIEIIENIRIDTNTNKKKRDAWGSITDLFNKVSKNNRTLSQIQNQWRKTKSLTKTNNNAFLRQIKQTGGGPPPPRLNSFDEELVGRIPKHFEQDFNLYDSNALGIERSNLQMENHPVIEILDYDEIEDVIIESCEEIQKPKGLKNKCSENFDETFKSEPENVAITDTEGETLKAKGQKNRHTDKVDENSKRIKLLDVSIHQKELEMKYLKIEFEKKISTWEEKKKVIELQIIQIREDHDLQNTMLQLQILQMKEEHELKIEKLKIEIHTLKKSGYFT